MCRWLKDIFICAERRCRVTVYIDPHPPTIEYCGQRNTTRYGPPCFRGPIEERVHYYFLSHSTMKCSGHGGEDWIDERHYEGFVEPSSSDSGDGK
jgi:hypothetical protein